MDFEQLLQYIDQEKLINTLLLIVFSSVFYFLGQRNAKADTLLSKSLKTKIGLYKGKCQDSIEYAQKLERSVKRIKKSKTLFFLLAVLGHGAQIYLLLPYLEISIIASISLLFLLFGYESFLNYRVRSSKSLLNATAKEIEDIGRKLADSLGDELLNILKQQLFKGEVERVKQQVEDQTRQSCQKEIEILKNKIKQLEQSEFQLKQENAKKKQVKSETLIVDNKIQIENEILRDFVSKVVRFEWCQDCIQSESDCISKYLEFCKIIGGEYNSRMAKL